MNIKPKFVYYDICRKQSVCLIMYTHENDVDTQVLEVSMLDNSEPIELSADYTYSAAIVNRDTKALINDNISCELNDSENVLIPIDNFHTLGAQDLLIELTITDSNGNQVLVTPFPLWIHVNASILDDAQVTPDSLGTIPELLEEAKELVEGYHYELTDDDVERIAGEVDVSGKADKATTLAGYGITDAYKKIDINQMFNQVDADLQGKADAIDTYTKTQVDTALSGKANSSDIPDISGKADKATTLSGYGINNAYTKTQTNTLLNAKESTANKVTAVDSSATDTQYPSAKAVYTLVSIVANNCEVKSNKVTAISSNSTDTQYPSAKAVFTAVNMPPQYVIDEAESVLAKAFAHKGLGRTIRFIAVSDSHNDATEASYAYTRVSNQHCGQAVKYIADRIPLDFVASLGDMTWAGVAHTTAQYQTDWLKEDIQEMNLFLKDGFSGFGCAGALEGGNGNDFDAEFLGKLLQVNPVAVFLNQVSHVYGDDNRDAQLKQLGGQIQVSFQVGAVDDIQDAVRVFIHKEVSGNNLLGCIR